MMHRACVADKRESNRGGISDLLRKPSTLSFVTNFKELTNTMLNTRFYCAALGYAACTLFALGCNNASPPPVPSPPPASHADEDAHDHGGEAPHEHGGEAAHDHANHDHGDHAVSGDSSVAKALASLSAEDRTAAEKQKTCPVSDESLGGMGTPIKVSVNGRDVFLCCEGCKETLQGDPDKYLAKLPQE